MEKTYKGKTNLDIVRSYLNGERPLITVGYSAPPVAHNEGEQWEDASGIKWEQRNGYKVRINPQAQLIREARKQKCECGQDIHFGSYYDEKIFGKTGKCFDCLIKEEQGYRVLGVFHHYENHKMLSNYLGFLRDMKGKIEDSIRYFKSEGDAIEMLCNGEGFIEKFKGLNTEELLVSAEKDLEEITKSIETVTVDKEKAKAIFDKEYKKAIKKVPAFKKP